MVDSAIPALHERAEFALQPYVPPRRVVVPPLKIHGNKSRLISWISTFLNEPDGRYIEPFLGSGSVALNCAGERALLGDINPHIIAFYQAVQNGSLTGRSVSKHLRREGERLKSDPDHFYAVRERFNQQFDPHDFLFLTRSSFNGVMRFNKKGRYNSPFCKRPAQFTPRLIERISRQVADAARLMSESWDFRNEDFESMIASAKAEDLIYCDPPYANRQNTFFTYWEEEDERRLFRVLSATPARFVLSTWIRSRQRKNSFVSAYWSRFNVYEREHFYHAGARLESRRPITEGLVVNF